MVRDHVRGISLLLVLTSACGGGGTDSKTPSIDGDYVLLTVDGTSPPVLVQSGLVGESLLGARLEVRGSGVRDIKQRRKTNSPTVTTDTAILTMSRIGERTFLTRPSDRPTAAPDTATIADGLVPNALLTWRTHSAPTNPSAFRASLVYTVQK